MVNHTADALGYLVPQLIAVREHFAWPPDQGNIANSLGVVMRVPGAFVSKTLLQGYLWIQSGKNKELDISPL